MSKKEKTKILALSVLLPKDKAATCDDMDSVRASWTDKDRRAFDVLMEAQQCWDRMSTFRNDRERNKRYTYGDQWGDIICVPTDTGCKQMTEEQYIARQGNVPLKNNLIRRLVRTVIGLYRNQNTEPTCIARDRDEQKFGETMSIVLQCNMALNKMQELLPRTMEEFLISGAAILRKSFGWRNGKMDCWTDYVPPNNFFIDTNVRDFRGWDVSIVGEVHDISFGQLCEQFANSPQDYARLKDIYKWARNKESLRLTAERFGYSKLENIDFLFTSEQGRCRVVEVWRKEQKPRWRCHDYLTGEIFKIDIEDYTIEVEQVNNARITQATEQGMDISEVPLIVTEWFMDDYWYYYYLSPFGDILQEGETPYNHGSHPYVFKFYPYIDGEIHSFVADVIDQQRYTNRLITMYDWIMRASAKGVLMIPKDCLPDDMSLEEFAQAWTEFNGVIMYQPSKSGRVPEQISAKSTNIGITELLTLQLQFFEDISGVTKALQGQSSFSGESAAHFNQQTANAATVMSDVLGSFSSLVLEGAWKDVKNIQQFYDEKRLFNIAGKNAVIEYDPETLGDVEFDLNISESSSTPAYRQLSNDILMQLWQAQAINVEQLLENGNFPFADDLLQSIRAQKEKVAQGEAPEGINQELLTQAQSEANNNAVTQARQAIKGK